MKPSDYYFNYGYDCFSFVDVDFWEENKHMNDECQAEMLLSKKFSELMDATFEYDGDPKEGIKYLLDNGFQQSKEFDDFLSGK